MFSFSFARKIYIAVFYVHHHEWCVVIGTLVRYEKSGASNVSSVCISPIYETVGLQINNLQIKQLLPHRFLNILVLFSDKTTTTPQIVFCMCSMNWLDFFPLLLRHFPCCCGISLCLINASICWRISCHFRMHVCVCSDICYELGLIDSRLFVNRRGILWHNMCRLVVKGWTINKYIWIRRMSDG